MNHLSFFWLSENRQELVESLESEFAQLVEQSIASGRITLPPIPDVVLKIQQLCIQEETGIAEITECLIEDPSLAAVVIRVANSVIFNRRNITCTDIQTAVSRLGIMRVRDIVTAQAIEQLKHTANLGKECSSILVKSAASSKEFAATMVLVTNELLEHSADEYDYLEVEKALLVGLLADIGLYCLVNEYHIYLDRGNYLDSKLALQIFNSRCPATSELVLKHWQFDTDFIEVAKNQEIDDNRKEISYLDIARMANHLLMFRRDDENIDEHHVEINLAGAEALYQLSNLNEREFKSRIGDVITATGL
ncbi:HDOD domain-containing protein [Vibrio sp. SCSIO 43137]|uniref:HDOD domain-containing protein n=1 Tax=Vibrio sp. SCSIO 43137 TaxID=3021011 RepID=UPI0023079F0A|nr:HDOD domain-containing protein [Vibrio sp. SCSIO 43137]WCE30950.1 HDOD domain-containing protein [Vibrio sp. SCSIO 43137]